MNDRSEGEYGDDVLRQYVEQHSGLDQYFNFDDRALFRKFAFCVTEQPDLLGNWREYAGHGEGFSIGFEAEELRKHFWLVRLVYDFEEKLEILNQVFESAIPVLTDSDIPDADKLQICSTIRTEANTIFKHSAFADEREWRFLQTDAVPGIVKYRASAFGPSPYIAAGKQSKIYHWPEFPVSQITCGPTMDRHLTVENTIRFLETIDATHIEVEASGAPLR